MKFFFSEIALKLEIILCLSHCKIQMILLHPIFINKRSKFRISDCYFYEDVNNFVKIHVLILKMFKSKNNVIIYFMIINVH